MTHAQLSSALWVHRQRLGRTPNTNGTSMPSLDRVRDPPPAWPGSLRLARTDPSTIDRPASKFHRVLPIPPRRGPRGSFRSCCFSSRAYVSGDALGPSGLAGGARPSEAPYDAELPDPMTRFYKIRRRQDLFNESGVPAPPCSETYPPRLLASPASDVRRGEPESPAES
ncbi:hypothetical protein THAOC_02831 [Thalassiosira oceanica]|uniref:Uncharacterized protein n=1 Tax=Thalassiosira oceanica TaxID=159749 RepID=K0TE59_THAOC|nr:hypothetical protein THAOC_02831 [Thalassiosira oceanica]|eukprot:EJK75444.1 hypothetical protein THAOC_02831 [Thalassiosira oceanica]